MGLGFLTRFAISFMAVLVATSGFAGTQSENVSCGQNERQLSLTSAHAIAALICNLQANNLTEKLSRNAQNSFNFVHEWSVNTINDQFVIDAT